MPKKEAQKSALPTDKEIAEQYEKDMANATAAAKLLKRAWFVADAEKPAAPTRKNKSL